MTGEGAAIVLGDSVMALVTKTLTSGIGCEVQGLDLDGDMAPATVAALREIWTEAGMVLFRNTATSPEALLKLSRCFGTLEPHPIETLRMTTHPELILLTNRDGPKGPVYAFDGVPTYGRIPWHTDLAFQTVPNAGALLQMVQKVPTGGRTAWLDTAAAYNALDDATKRRIANLEVRFEFCADLGQIRFNNPGGVRVGDFKARFPDYPAIARPLVWQHPVSGQTILNICPLNLRSIVGMENAEGDALLQALIDHAVQSRFVYEHDWDNGDIILWDNYRMMHATTGHPLEEVRIVHRSTLRGETTVGHSLAALEAA
jgi:taurine dioxygenase